MKVLKLPWLAHKEEHRKYEVYAADVSPDGERLATGGLDGKIRIWSIPDILRVVRKDPRLDEEAKVPLASMSRHTGSVTTVKFSPDGKFLASGSDDRILLIWERDEEQKQPIFGSESDKEHWNVRRRLVAHDNDIQDICWAPDGSILVTVGLDRSVIIWNGSTFEKIKRFDVHQSLVKGVIFDPANKYFATASDDRTLRIFRYHKAGDLNFSIEHVVSEPFKGSPITTYFRRLSWSPDGQHIAVPNATNGPVSSVSIVSRGNWDTNVTLIGHDSPTEVVRFNPRLFQVIKENKTKGSQSDTRVDDNKPEENTDAAEGRSLGDNSDTNSAETEDSVEEKVDSIIATAGQDKTLVLWSTGRAKPLLVAYDITNKSITDMVWSPDGTILFLTALDGSIITVVFETGELGNAIPLEKNVEHLHRYGVDKDSFDFPEGIKQLELEDKAKLLDQNRSPLDMYSLEKPEQVLPNKMPGTAQAPTILSVKRKEPSSDNNIPTTLEKRVKPAAIGVNKDSLNQMVVKNGRKRVAPTLISSGYSPTKPTETKQPSFKDQSPALKNIEAKDLFDNLKDKISCQAYPLPRLGVHSLIMGVRQRGVDKFHREEEITEKVRDTQGDARESDTDAEIEHVMRINSKTTADKVFSDEPNTRYVETPSVLPDADVVLVEFGELDDMYIMEIRNGVERGLQFEREALVEHPTRILGYHHSERVMDLLIPEVVICAVGSVQCKCWALATAEGNLLIYTSYGQHKLPKIALGHKAVKMVTIARFLIVLTESGLLYAWDIENGTCVHKKVPVMPILYGSPAESNRVRVQKKIMKISMDLKSRDLLVAFMNPQESFSWNADLGCWGFCNPENTHVQPAADKLTPMSAPTKVTSTC
ncbi:LADA_0G04698g1_1 [Lachancea dasiensis]|uniref:Protein HIR n=1 Tax=Lachancea dasiensis TaxID=1072105 RepID=A0A1G4JSQ0_9SACH|nr:LADA_0G04698g1_1 [Lachancea dasiensis]